MFDTIVMANLVRLRTSSTDTDTALVMICHILTYNKRWYIPWYSGRSAYPPLPSIRAQMTALG